MREVFQAIVEALDRGEPVAVLTVVRASGSTPRHLPANMMVRADGTFVGSIGGGSMEWQAIRDAQEALTQRQSRLVDYALTSKEPGNLGLCGGTEQVFIDVVVPNPTLLLIGAGHIGKALTKMAKVLEWRVVVVDDRADYISPEQLPDADERILVRYEPETETLAPIPVAITPTTFVLLATWGWDEPALRQVVSSPAAYIGLVASARKGILIFRDLIAEGMSPDTLARVHVPTGLDLGAERPAEIALSILAEMLMVERHATGSPMAKVKGSAVMERTMKGVNK